MDSVLSKINYTKVNAVTAIRIWTRQVDPTSSVEGCYKTQTFTSMVDLVHNVIRIFFIIPVEVLSSICSVNTWTISIKVSLSLLIKLREKTTKIIMDSTGGQRISVLPKIDHINVRVWCSRLSKIGDIPFALRYSVSFLTISIAIIYYTRLYSKQFFHALKIDSISKIVLMLCI